MKTYSRIFIIALIATFSTSCVKELFDETGTFTDDRDGHIYQIVKIGNQWWMAENLNFTTVSGSFCYNNNYLNCITYGRLYNGEAAIIACPSGWHLPSDEEWKQLEIFLGMTPEDANELNCRYSGKVGEKLKSIYRWNGRCNGSGSGNNLSGFDAIPSGEYTYTLTSNGLVGYCNGLTRYANFWTNSEYDSTKSMFRYLNSCDFILFQSNANWVGRNANNKADGFSVRCIKDD